jgi:hypothetical protein
MKLREYFLWMGCKVKWTWWVHYVLGKEFYMHGD